MTQRIMVVEDENIVALDVQHRLETLGYQVVAHATCAADAVQFASDLEPDLILMDIKIRGPVDGIEAAAQIRLHQDIPIIYLTAFADESTLQRARLTEAFGYIIKPFEDRELQSAIEIALYKHKMEKKLRESEERYALAARATNDGLWDWNLSSDEIYYASRWRSMLGLGNEPCFSNPDEWFSRVHPEDIGQLKLAIADHLQGVTPVLECEHRIMHQDGGLRWMLCRGLAVFDAQGKAFRLAGSQSDITTRKQLEEQLIHKALYDELTGLPNRALFMDRLKIVMAQTQRHTQKIAAVIFLDIDHFKDVNDSLGHACGDAMLVAFAHRLQQCLRPSDTVARFGGDEFAILVDGIHAENEATQVAQRLCDALASPFSIAGQDIFSGASLGIVFINARCNSIEDVLRDADSAMYQAKKNGRAGYVVFDASMHERTLSRFQQEGEIRRALRNNEFRLYYQPVYALENMKLVGFEALIRWQHPERGLLYPAEFISLAEQTGLIIPIGEWVLLTACAQLREWQAAGYQLVWVAVNISALQFNDQNLVQTVQAALNKNGIAPQYLQLELTETAAIQNSEHALNLLRRLHALGVRVAIDDFGKGYSSLDALKNFPGDMVKIDRTFIQDITEAGTAIVSAMIAMAHQLRLQVTAEGIETENQLKLLAKMDCDRIQGYYLGKPAPPEAVWAKTIASQGIPRTD